MRILIIASLAESLINFRGPLILSLIEAGVEVHVAAPGLDSNEKTKHRLENMKVKPIDITLNNARMNPLSDIRTLIELTRVIKNCSPTHVLCYTAKPVIYGIIAAKVCGVPKKLALITGLGYSFIDSKNRKLINALVRALYKISLTFADRIIFQNPDDLQYFISSKIIPNKDKTIIVNGSGIDLDYFPPKAVPKEPHFLLIARLLKDKGIREYFDSARSLKSKYPHVRFSLVGWIDENPNSISREELDEVVREGYIEFHGKVDDVRPLIESCSVYVLPSYREGTPRSVLEAMSCSRAIITTDTAGCRETVIEGKNGFLVPVRSALELESAMERFIVNPTLATQMGPESRTLAELKYDVRKVNATFLDEIAA